ncbi:hypothetical protein B0H14DRAFT_2573000 [Mycena olivaceomarginata]|nr:hypothetical protein B0H14DRAFT_2573000 [Mycena olivaceomarginata]
MNQIETPTVAVVIHRGGSVNPILPSATWHWMSDKGKTCAGNPGGAYFCIPKSQHPTREAIGPRTHVKAEFLQIIPYESSSRGAEVEGIIQTINAKSLCSDPGIPGRAIQTGTAVVLTGGYRIKKVQVGHGYNRGYCKANPHPYPPKPYPARVGYKTRAGKPAVPQPPAGRSTRRVEHAKIECIL